MQRDVHMDTHRSTVICTWMRMSNTKDRCRSKLWTR